MAGKFKLKKIINFKEMQLDDVLEESDYSTFLEDKFYQFKYHETEEQRNYSVKPGIFTINKNMGQLILEPTDFSDQEIMEQFVSTEAVSKEIDTFFAKLDVYRKYRKNETPRRSVLLWGAPGTGKSTSITKVCKTYAKDSKTAVILWATAKFEAYEVKDLVKSFKYEGVEKIIFVIEDIGGVEVSEAHMGSDSELLSLLDNTEKIFTMPTFIIATTNFPANFMETLTNRPGRIDRKIEIGHPDSSQRLALFKFFNDNTDPTAEVAELINSKKCAKLTPAHLKEVVIRSAIYDKSHTDSVEEILQEIVEVEKQFQKKKSMGMGIHG